MRVIVVGAGLTGLQTAYALASSPDVSVTLIEALNAPCQGASYSCAAVLGAARPSPIVPAKRRWRRVQAGPGESTGLNYSAGALLRYPRFLAQLNRCRLPDAALPRQKKMAEWAVRSADMLRSSALLSDFELQEGAGTLIIGPADAAREAEQAKILDHVLDVEPSLFAANDISILACDRATSWSVSYYAKQLKEHLLAGNTDILNARRVTGLTVDNGVCTGVMTADGKIPADAVVVAAGTGATALVPKKLLGGAAVAPITRSLVNVRLRSSAMRIRHAIADRHGRLAAPLDDFLRIMGRWYLGSTDRLTREIQDEYKSLWDFGVRVFPDLAHWSHARYISQTVLATPDGLPLVGATAMKGLYLNIAGGLHGADFAPVYALAAADAVLGRESGDLAALSVERFH